jgi:hypothetical protein
MSQSVRASGWTIGRLFAFVAATLLGSACARVAQTRPVDVVLAPAPRVAACEHCIVHQLAPELTLAIEQRIADLVSRGQSCSVYGQVLERSYRERRISIRPYMWREGTRLVSGEATVEGDMQLAREIDSLNVGVRTLDDLLRTMEHEAVHIAFRIPSRDESTEARVNDFVRECNTSSTDDRGKANARSSPRSR